MNTLSVIYRCFNQLAPPILRNPLLSFASLCLFILNGEYKLTRKNTELISVATKKRAFIIATGPSIREQDLTLLEGEDCFTVSNFILHKDLRIVNPKIHFVAPYHKPLIYEEYINWLKKIDALLPDSTKIVMSCRSEGMVSKEKIFKNRRVYYISTQKYFWSTKIDITKSVLSPQSSPLMILPVLHNMGYKEIYLVGCDHNILKDYGGIVSNFYDQKNDCRSNATSGDNWSAGIICHLEFAKNVFIQYQEYQKRFIVDEVKLFNCSQSSWLDFIEYKKFENIFKDYN